MKTRSPTHSSNARKTLTLIELADLLGISRTVAYELAARDALPVPTIRVGRQYRFSRRSFEDLMNEQHPPSRDAS